MNSQAMSISELIFGASPVVQLIMGLLVLASVVTWVIIFQRAKFYKGLEKRGSIFASSFLSERNFDEHYRRIKDLDRELLSPQERVFATGYEAYRDAVRAGHPSEVVMDMLQRQIRIMEYRDQTTLERSLNMLATIGSVSPFVGLLGTVIGVMNSFRGLAFTQQATLASVAPGIAEALVATAMGLFAAIPAVVAYNRFNGRVDRLMSDTEILAEEFVADAQVHLRKLQKA